MGYYLILIAVALYRFRLCLNYSAVMKVDLFIIGKGRGKQVIAVARTADLVIIMLDASKGETQKYAFF